jgi:hypothetical protein
MSFHQGTCIHCGNSFTARSPKAKYCRVCRLADNCRYLRDRRHKCESCNDEFAPLAREDKLCAPCDTPGGRRSVPGRCVLCEKEGERAQLHPDLQLCLRCAKDPARRPMVRLGLARKMQQRMEAAAQHAA